MQDVMARLRLPDGGPGRQPARVGASACAANPAMAPPLPVVRNLLPLQPRGCSTLLQPRSSRTNDWALLLRAALAALTTAAVTCGASQVPSDSEWKALGFVFHLGSFQQISAAKMAVRALRWPRVAAFVTSEALLPPCTARLSSDAVATIRCEVLDDVVIGRTWPLGATLWHSAEAARLRRIGPAASVLASPFAHTILLAADAYPCVTAHELLAGLQTLGAGPGGATSILATFPIMAALSHDDGATFGPGSRMCPDLRPPRAFAVLNSGVVVADTTHPGVRWVIRRWITLYLEPNALSKHEDCSFRNALLEGVQKRRAEVYTLPPVWNFRGWRSDISKRAAKQSAANLTACCQPAGGSVASTQHGIAFPQPPRYGEYVSVLIDRQCLIALPAS